MTNEGNFLSTRSPILLAVNALCFGACIVLLALTSAKGPLVLLTIGTGLAFLARLAGAIIATRQTKREEPSSSTKNP